MICERLFPNHKEDDIHVISDELKIPMKCPVTLSEINIPAKGFLCAHVECFDLLNFLKTNRSFRTFKCPHCNKSSNLIKIDPFLLIMKQIYTEKSQRKDLDSCIITKNLDVICENLTEPISMSTLVDSYISIIKNDIYNIFAKGPTSKIEKLSDSEDEIAKEPTDDSKKTPKPLNESISKFIEID